MLNYKSIKRSFACVMSAILAASIIMASGCGKGKENGETSSTVIWTAHSATKIMQDKEYDGSFTSEKAVKINMAKNESESGQIIVTAGKDIGKYNVAVGDLKSGSNIIPAEDITLYNEKYIEVTTSSKNMDTPLGFYPDALLPFEKAIEYGENCIKKGHNQGIWVDIKTTKDTKPGLYKGEIILDLDGQKESVGVEVNVWDILIDDEVHARSSFYTKPRFYAMAEKDPDDRLMEKYVDRLLDFKLSPLYLPYFGSVDSANVNIDEYVKEIKKYTLDKRLTYYQIPYSTTYATGTKTIVESSLTDYIAAIGKASIEENRNLLEKAGLYLSNLIDEPELNDTVGEIKKHNDAVKRCKQNAIRELEKLPASELLSEVIDSVNNIPHILTNRFIDGQEDNVDIWCPTLNKFHTEAGREIYENEEEVWWYGCIDPQAPYATYYIDDLSPAPRVMSWMQKDYNISGNLYWAVDLYGDRFDMTRKINPYTDLPTRASWGSNPGANGDGFLFYPGSYYGIDGPVDSLRLFNIRDGLEDYELLYQIETLYEQNGKDSKDILSLVYKKLYEGTKVFHGTSNLEKAREEVADILILAKNGVYVDNAVIDRDIAKISVSSVNNKSVKINGENTLKKDIGLDSNDNNLKIECENVTLDLRISGKANVLSYSDGKTTGLNVKKGSVRSVEKDNRAMAEISMENDDKTKRQSFSFSHPMLNEIDNNSSLVFTFFVEKLPTDAQNIRLEIFMKGSKNPVLVSYEIFNLKEGYNTVKLDKMYYLNWKQLGKLNELYFEMGDVAGNHRRIYLLDISTYVD